MFIKQVNTSSFRFYHYLPILIGFLIIIVYNYLASLNTDINLLIHQMIDSYGRNVTFVLMIFPTSVCCLILFAWVKIIHRQSIKSLTTSREKIDWRRIFFSFFLWSGFTIITTLLNYFLHPTDFKFNFSLIPFLNFLCLAIIFIPLQTGFEEYFFRGYMMQGIGVLTKSTLFPLFFTSVFFGLTHISNPEVGMIGYFILFYYIGAGFFLGIITLLDDGIELALGFHVANNLVGSLLVTSDWSALQTNSIFKDVSKPSYFFDSILIMLLFLVLLYIFNKKYKWKNWKEKLTENIN